MSQSHVDQERFNDLKRFCGAYMSALSDQITALQNVVTTTGTRVQGDIANLQTQLAAVQANAANQFTATDLANLQSLQTQIAAIDAPPAPVVTPAQAPAPAAPVTTVAPAPVAPVVPTPVVPTPAPEVPAAPVAPVESPTPAPAA
jgi:hypothetical protein